MERKLVMKLVTPAGMSTAGSCMSLLMSVSNAMRQLLECTRQASEPLYTRRASSTRTTKFLHNKTWKLLFSTYLSYIRELFRLGYVVLKILDSNASLWVAQAKYVPEKGRASW